MKVLSVVGARPNFMKVAPLHRAMVASGVLESRIVHTGQHYDEKMSDIFFTQLELPKPHIYLGIGSGSHAEQTAKVMVAFEKVLAEENPDMVLVVGDVNSTLACSIVCAKQHVPIAHVEAGLRSFDREMPEEINRMVTDRISDYLFVTEQSGIDNLKNEGTNPDSVFFVGNVMIDSLVHFRAKAAKSTVLYELDLLDKPYVLMTTHRPSNVDDKNNLTELVRIVEGITKKMHLVFPMHPRTQKQLEKFELLDRIEGLPNLTITEPLGYLEFLRLMENAEAVVTDSGGIQEETTFLQVPCLTLRENTERPVTITQGTNELLPLDQAKVLCRLDQILEGEHREGTVPPLWDGRAAERITACLIELIRGRQRA